MNTRIFETREEMGTEAAATGIAQLKRAIDDRGEANLIVATGNSQFEMLENLRSAALPWNRINGYHLDEYIGLPIAHDASFRKYLADRFLSRLPESMKAFCYLDGEADPVEECERASALIQKDAIDVAFVGIGENGHLAFNDPPADFETDVPYIVVDLDEDCRNQQFGEGWFPDLEAVPKQAISMSVRQIMESQCIVCTVPDRRKAKAVRDALQGKVTPDLPASILQTHPNCHVFLDAEAASLL